MSQCLFCKIIEGSEDAVIVYEDEQCIAFMDIFPISKGHILLIPKTHSEKLDAQTDQVKNHLFEVSNKLIYAQRQANLGVDGTHFLINDGVATNQHIQHVHIHLIPRKTNDNLNFAYKIFMHFSGLFGFKAKREKLQQAADQIKLNIDVPIKTKTAL